MQSQSPTYQNKSEQTRFSLSLSLALPASLRSDFPLEMKPNMATSRPSQDFSSRRHFHWTKKVATEDDHQPPPPPPPTARSFKPNNDHEEKKESVNKSQQQVAMHTPKKKLPAVAVARLRSVLSTLNRNRSNGQLGLGSRVVGTLFGYRRGHVHFAFQKDPNSPPAFLVELATPISGLVKEMASGLVRIALECDKEKEEEKKAARLLEEPLWRTYCNGKKCGFATRRECGAKEWKVLKAVEPISMGAGVLPGTGPETGGGGGDGELMYMRAKFERIVGSSDSEAFYMMNPDSNGAPELSVYLLRI